MTSTRGPRRLQFRLGRVMIVVALVAMVLAASRNRWLALGTLIAFFVSCLFVVASGLVELLLGVRCPGCGSWEMQRLACGRSGSSITDAPPAACGGNARRPAGIGPTPPRPRTIAGFNAGRRRIPGKMTPRASSTKAPSPG